MKIYIENNTNDIDVDISIVAEALGIEVNKDGKPVLLKKTNSGLYISHTNSHWELSYSSTVSFYRGLGLLKQFWNEGVGFEYSEIPKFDALGVMIDCSRNAVPNCKALKEIFIQLALMGYNNVQLYTEDVFEMEGYPYFGYLRGRYSQSELQELDEFANKLGIEIVPCIQTLAHLARAFNWRELEDIVDCNDILLCEEEKTYEFIDDMFRTMSTAFKSRSINIGMDEAHMLGLGKYLEKNGYVNRFDILMKHLTRVVEIARKYGYRPMMWSDMFFRLANNGEYYSNGKRIEQEIINKVPKDVSLIYWDYYTEDESKYNAMMQSHNEFGRKVVFAGGAWKWVGFTPQNEYSMKLAEVAGKACINNEIKDVLITCWGDNGAEASLLSVMPTLNYWAEICWATNNMKWCSKRFEVCCNISYEDFIKIDEPLYIPGNPSPGEMGVNPTKYLLYQDILMGMIDYENIEDNVSEHFRRCGNMLTDIANDNQNWYKIFKAQAELCYLLEIKATIGIRLRDAYKKDNKDILIVIAKKLIPEMINRLEKFQNAYHDQWYAENKPFGLEVFDIRTGGLKERALTAAKRINAYLMGETQEIEELDVEILPFAIRVFAGNPLSSVHWEKISTPAALFWM